MFCLSAETKRFLSGSLWLVGGVDIQIVHLCWGKNSIDLLSTFKRSRRWQFDWSRYKARLDVERDESWRAPAGARRDDKRRAGGLARAAAASTGSIDGASGNPLCGLVVPGNQWARAGAMPHPAGHYRSSALLTSSPSVLQQLAW